MAKAKIICPVVSSGSTTLSESSFKFMCHRNRKSNHPACKDCDKTPPPELKITGQQEKKETPQMGKSGTCQYCNQEKHLVKRYNLECCSICADIMTKAKSNPELFFNLARLVVDIKEYLTDEEKAAPQEVVVEKTTGDSLQINELQAEIYKLQATLDDTDKSLEDIRRANEDLGNDNSAKGETIIDLKREISSLKEQLETQNVTVTLPAAERISQTHVFGEDDSELQSYSFNQFDEELKNARKSRDTALDLLKKQEILTKELRAKLKSRNTALDMAVRYISGEKPEEYIVKSIKQLARA